jgi:hypothetical protein
LKARIALSTADNVVINSKKTSELNMSENDKKVVGYIASTSRTNVICVDKDACLVAGSEAAMRNYLAEIEIKASSVSIRKARFGDIAKVMLLGGRYSFDKEAYSRFYPLGLKEGMLLEQPEFDEEKGQKFFSTQLDPKSL